MKENLLLHVCCAPCGVFPITLLQDTFSLILIFYGPNIHPKEEYIRRLDSVRQISKRLIVPLVELEYDADNWRGLMKGLGDEPEGGKRCSRCYEMRLSRTARFAKENGYKYFTATLTLSPHKPAHVINPIGESIAKKHGLVFLAEDFKKKDGFKKSCELSKEYGLYRQTYCGCEYSKRESGNRGIGI